MNGPRHSRILMLLENAPYLLDSRVRPEAETLAAAGYRVSVICPGNVGERGHETVNDVHIYRYPVVVAGHSRWTYGLEYGYALAATFVLAAIVFLRRGFDVIHAHNPPDLFFLIALLYKPFGVRFVCDQHDLAPDMYAALFDGGNSRIFDAMVQLQRLSCRVADHVIVTNKSYQRVVMARAGLSAARITIVRNGPDPRKLLAGPLDQAVLPFGKCVLCYVGVMGRHDGIDLLLYALQHLAFDLGRTDFHCLLVGSGGAYPRMKELCGELGLSQYVTLVGWVDPTQVGRYLHAADICLAPEPSNSYNDRSTAIKLAEYMAVGKSIVAFDLPEHRVTAGAAARYAKPNETMDFARHIAALMDAPALRGEMGSLGRQRVETELAWSHQARALLGVYAALLASDAQVTERSYV